VDDLGRCWGAEQVISVDRPERVPVVTDLSVRQSASWWASWPVAPLFGISKSAAGRVADHLAPLLALAPVTR
jgi:hypothetical protein